METDICWYELPLKFVSQFCLFMTAFAGQGNRSRLLEKETFLSLCFRSVLHLPPAYLHPQETVMKMFNRKVADSIPAGVNGFFIDIKSFRLYCVPGVDSAASNRNEYQEYFLGVKSGRCVRVTTLPPSCAVVTKSENLNFLESPGTVQACNGTAIPLATFVAGQAILVK